MQLKLKSLSTHIGVAVLLCCGSPISAQSPALTLSSGSALPGGTVTLNLSLTAGSTAPAGLQWALNYSTADIAAVSMATGPASTAAGKSLSCAAAAGVYTCVDTGLNTVPIAPGAIAVATITLAPATVSTTINITGSLGATPGGDALPVTAAGGVIKVIQPPVTVSSVACNPPSLGSNATSLCTVSLSSVVPAGGITLNAGSDNSALSVPAAVNVPSGSSAGFNATTGTLVTDGSANVTVSYNGSSAKSSIGLAAPVTVSSLVCTPGSLGSSATSVCTVTLSKAAPAGGVVVALNSNDPLLVVPASVTFTAGSTVQTFTATSGAVPSSQTATVTASYNSTSQTAPVSLGGTSFLTGYALNGPPLRNNFSGWVGMQVTVGASALSIATLGRICVSGNSGMHLVKVVNAASGTDLPGGSVTLNMAGCSGGHFVYGAPAGALTLQANTAYDLISYEVFGGDQWFDYGLLSSTSVAAVNAPVYSFDGLSWIPVRAPNSAYVPLDFQYSTSVSSPPPPAPEATLLSGYNLNNRPLRNNFSGWVGMALKVGAAGITIQSLGRICVVGNSGSHIVKVVRAADGTDLPGASVSVSMQGGVAGQFSYAALPSPVTLQANTSYYLVSQEVLGGDQWYDYGTVATTSSAAAVTNAVYWDGVQWALVAGANMSYVPPNFK